MISYNSAGRTAGPQSLNITSTFPRVVQAYWFLQPNSSSTSFTITCNSSSSDTLSLSGSLQDALSDEGVYTATIIGLDPDTLYTCCLSLRSEERGSSIPQCQNVQQLTTARGQSQNPFIAPINRGNDSMTLCNATVTSSPSECPSLPASTTTTTKIVTATLVLKTTVRVPLPATTQAGVFPTTRPRVGKSAPLSWSVAIIIGVLIGIGIMTVLVIVGLVIVLFRIRKLSVANKRINE